MTMKKAGGRRRQQGLSFLEMILLLAVAGFLVMTGIKLVPVYMEYFNVASSVDSLGNVAAPERTESRLRELLQRRLDVNNVSLKPDQVQFTRENDGTIRIHVHYRRTTHWFANISLVVTFNRSVAVPPG